MIIADTIRPRGTLKEHPFNVTSGPVVVGISGTSGKDDVVVAWEV